MNTVAFVPNGLRYLVLPDPVEAKSETIGEITISQQADVHQKASEGTVVSVGDVPCKYSVSDKVIYGKYAGYEHSFDGIEYKVLGESEILGIRVLKTPFDVMQISEETGRRMGLTPIKVEQGGTLKEALERMKQTAESI